MNPSSASVVVLLTLLIVCNNIVASYKVLVPIITASTSHFNQAKAICDILHERGHEITFLHGYAGKKLPYRQIIIPEILNDDFDAEFDNRKVSFIDKLNYVLLTRDFVTMMYDNALNSQTFQKFINDKNEKFDLIIMDYILQDVLFALGIRYNCPIIVISPASMLQWLARRVGNPVSPATVPNFFLDVTSNMSFGDKILNSIMCIFQDAFSLVFDSTQRSYYEKYFPAEAAAVDFDKLKRMISLVFANTHPSLGYARALMPNSVEVAGFHIDKIPPLPKEYQDILDNAKNGVIFFSMGSFLKTHTMPKPMRDVILKSLSKLNETVLWKFETELEGLPKNVIIKKWMPQPSILAHPNVKLFISHGGVLSTIEATMSGVPVLSIPVAFDQFHNAKMIEHSKTGVIMPLDKLTESCFDEALQEILNNKIYTENAKKLKRSFNDRPLRPRDLIAFYAEHVVRTGGAKHLSPPHMDLASSLLLDVFAVLIVPPILLLTILILIIKKMCCSKNKTAHKAEKQKHS